MKRKLFTLALAGLVAFSFVGTTSCGKDDDDDKKEEVTVEKVKVTFDTDGGSEVAAIEAEKAKNLKLASITAPTKEGFTFKGWATSKGGDVVTEIKPEADVTLYAIWVEGTNDNGGSGNQGDVEGLALDLSTIWSQFSDVTTNDDGTVTLKMSKGDADWQKGEFGFVIPADKQEDNYTKFVIKYKDATAQDGIGCVFHFESEQIGWFDGETANQEKFAFEEGEDVKTLTLVPEAPADKMATVRIFDFGTGNSITIVSVTAVAAE